MWFIPEFERISWMDDSVTHPVTCRYTGKNFWFFLNLLSHKIHLFVNQTYLFAIYIKKCVHEMNCAICAVYFLFTKKNQFITVFFRDSHHTCYTLLVCAARDENSALHFLAVILRYTFFLSHHIQSWYQTRVKYDFSSHRIIFNCGAACVSPEKWCRKLWNRSLLWDFKNRYRES